MFTDSGYDWPKIDYADPRQYFTIWETNNEKEEDEMSLTKEHKYNKLSEEDRLAVDLGALNEDGTLTLEGKDLLLNVLLETPDIRKAFDKALKEIGEF